MKNEQITEQESLQIIQSMIAKTKKQITDRSFYFFLWGFAVMACAILQYILLKMDFSDTQFIWLLMPVLAVIHITLSIKDRKKEKILTYNTKAIGALWTGLGIGFFILVFLSISKSLDIVPFLILFYGIGIFVTGKILDFLPLILGGIGSLVLSMAVVFINGNEELLLLALSVLISYIIPAFFLKREFKKNNN